ncbi:MAG TPA: diguanylate cyclase [Bryobacteraceae bacterium]|nr:diguanylate cyclase [Bryobacteraceae bacterium]
MSILIIDDDPDDLDVLQSILAGTERWNIAAARSTEEALRALETGEVEMVLADIMTPATGGLEICRQIKARPELAHTPVVIIMAGSERSYLTQAYESGACDYLMKPLDPVEVAARVGAVLRSKEEVDRRIAHEHELLAAARKLQAANQQLLRLSVVDALTGIANRRSFDQTLDRVWRSASRHQREVALIMIDIDFFKSYNDSLGHPAGDDCLRRVAKELTDALKRPDDFLARYGGEEFVVILPQTDLAGVSVVAERLRGSMEALDIRHPASTIANHVTISQGVASILPTREAARFTLISMADEALYGAKKSGRNRVSTLAEAYQQTLSGFAASQSHNRTPKLAELFSNRPKPQ